MWRGRSASHAVWNHRCYLYRVRDFALPDMVGHSLGYDICIAIDTPPTVIGLVETVVVGELKRQLPEVVRCSRLRLWRLRIVGIDGMEEAFNKASVEAGRRTGRKKKSKCQPSSEKK